MYTWYGVLMRAGTPKEIVARPNAKVNKAQLVPGRCNMHVTCPLCRLWQATAAAWDKPAARHLYKNSDISPLTQKSENGFLRLENIRKSFGATPVVDDLSLGINAGEFVSILGPSGVGKTTLLRIIAGFIQADGSIWLDNRRIDLVPSHRRGAAMVFQNYALFPHMSVFDNVAFGLRRQKMASQEILRRVGEALALVHLPELKKRYPRELSGGEQQRVALARAIVLRPKLLLLDEPLSNLDAKLRKGLRQEFLGIHRAAGITSLFITHDLEEAFSISDRVAVMNKGKIEQFGPPVEIFTRPKTQFVSDFVGHSNILEGEVAIDAQGPFMAVGALAVRLSPEAAPGRKHRVAVPGHLVQISAQALAAANCFRGRLVSMNYLGSTIHFTVDLGEFKIVGEMPAHAENLKLREGRDVYAAWSSTDMIELPGMGG